MQFDDNFHWLNLSPIGWSYDPKLWYEDGDMSKTVLRWTPDESTDAEVLQ